MIRFEYDGPAAPLDGRQILAEPCDRFFAAALSNFSSRRKTTGWTITLDRDLLFDVSGLRLLSKAVQAYRGPANRLRFCLHLDPATYRDYYSLGLDAPEGCINLPVTAQRLTENGVQRWETLNLKFRYGAKNIAYPRSLAEPIEAKSPLALLMQYRGEFDILFANQIALFAALARMVPRQPLALVRAAVQRRRGSWVRRASIAFRQVHRTAEVHPTAVVEGSVIEAGARVGAHCVVRYSHIGPNVELFDGAKVECSVVGAGSWLMHDLVLFRSYVEEEVFLIHGPYQFSAFHSGSAAFATIMMDYRPDDRPIKALTVAGVRPYQGRFLGALLREGAKSLGGSLLAPGIIIPRDTWLAGDLDMIHRSGRTDVPQRLPSPPPQQPRRERIPAESGRIR